MLDTTASIRENPLAEQFDARFPDGDRASSVAEMRDGLRKQGAILIPGVVDLDVCRGTIAGIDERYRVNGDEFDQVNGVCGGQLRTLVDPVLESVSKTVFLALAKAFLDADEVVVPVNHMLFRRRDDAVDAIYEARGAKHIFHQDHGLIPESFPLNTWVALSEVGEDCHGLSFVLPCPSGPVRTQQDELQSYLEANSGRIWSPKMRAGDLLVFHQLTIHGSWINRGKPNARYSAEFRAGRLGNSPPDYSNVLYQLQS
jgi:hypothetical protein